MGDKNSSSEGAFISGTCIEQDYSSAISMSGLLSPEPMKLKGSENYPLWKQVMVRNIIAGGLIKYFKTNQTEISQMDMSNWKSLSDKHLDKVLDWIQGNTRAANMIMFNCVVGPQSDFATYYSAADIWNALEKAYEGTGIVVQLQELINFVSMKYNDYDDLSTFIIVFKNTIQRLSQLMDKDDKIPTYWPAMIFVHALQNKFPIWADRQRNRQRNKNYH